MASQRQALSVIEGLGLDGLEKEITYSRKDNIKAIGLTLRGDREKLQMIESLLCDASHSRLTSGRIKESGLIDRFYRYQDKIIDFLNAKTELARTSYLGLGSDTEYLLDLNKRNRLFISLEYGR